MKQITIISGKGGTGKTMLTASFAVLAEKCVIADCDVDAANLHLLLKPVIKKKYEFKAGYKAKIDKTKCTECFKCVKLCRFNAISKDYMVDEVYCEGCGLCAQICPAEAVVMEENKAGEWFISDTKYGSFIHAKLGIAQDNSGKLVTKVRQVAHEIALQNKSEIIIIDGPPGIGCPVMASLTGVDFAVAVTEPTVSGIHDLKRVIDVTSHFKIRTGIVINKSDINSQKTEEIEGFVKKTDAIMLGRVSFSPTVNDAIVKGIPPVLYCDKKITGEIKYIWKEVMKGIMTKGGRKYE